MDATRADLHWVIDTDAGIDDALALLMVCARQGRSLQAVTCTAGNTSLDQVVKNVLLTLDEAGLEVPVYAGCARPLLGQSIPLGDLMGPDGLGGATQHLEPTARLPKAQHASMAVLDASRTASPLAFLALGPLTNLALAIGVDNSLPGRVERLVIMGGAVQAQGNAGPASEFNFACDPEAAFAVLQAGFKDVLVVPWETCIKAALPWEDYRQICARQTPAACFFSLLTGQLAKILDEQFGLPGLVLPDVLAAALAFDESLAVDIHPAYAGVLTARGAGRGFMPVDWRGIQGGPSNVRLVMDIEPRRFHSLLRSVFGDLS